MKERRYVWGINPALEALRARPEDIEQVYFAEGQLPAGPAGELFARAKAAGIRTRAVGRERLAGLAEGGVHQGVVVELVAFEYAELTDILAAPRPAGRAPLIVALDGIQDVHNLGAIIRSAHALGADAVVIPKDRAAQVTGAAAKASAGAIEHCPVVRTVNLSRALKALKDEGLWVIAADAAGPQPAWKADLRGPLCLVIGGEASGVRPNVLKQCDMTVAIPMLGRVGSLNASVSAGVLLYEVARQRSNVR